MKNIAIALHAGTPALRNAVTNMLLEAKWAYWHWIDDLWLIQVPDTYTPKALYDRMAALPEAAAATILVFELHGMFTYWGRAPTESWAWFASVGKPG